MKRKGNLFELVQSPENIAKAFCNSKKGKSKYKMVQVINESPDKYLNDIQSMIAEGRFKNSAYRVFKVCENGKEREIYSLPYFPDRIVQHAIVQIIEPIFHSVYIENTYASIKGRGIHAGVRRIKKALRDVDNTTYCLKLDIRKFYQSVDHDILKSLIARKIKDKKMLSLLDEIIDSAEGLPIGNYLSQQLANFYLAYFDHFVKEVLKVRYYFRYCDDMVLLCSDKSFLHRSRVKIEEYLNDNLNLQLKDNYQVFPVDDRGIDFLGYKFYHTHTLIRKRIKMRMIRILRKNRANVKQSMTSYWGWCKHANTYNLRRKYNINVA